MYLIPLDGSSSSSGLSAEVVETVLSTVQDAGEGIVREVAGRIFDGSIPVSSDDGVLKTSVDAIDEVLWKRLQQLNTTLDQLKTGIANNGETAAKSAAKLIRSTDSNTQAIPTLTSTTNDGLVEVAGKIATNSTSIDNALESSKSLLNGIQGTATSTKLIVGMGLRVFLVLYYKKNTIIHKCNPTCGETTRNIIDVTPQVESLRYEFSNKFDKLFHRVSLQNHDALSLRKENLNLISETTT